MVCIITNWIRDSKCMVHKAHSVPLYWKQYLMLVHIYIEVGKKHMLSVMLYKNSKTRDEKESLVILLCNTHTHWGITGAISVADFALSSWDNAINALSC